MKKLGTVEIPSFYGAPAGARTPNLLTGFDEKWEPKFTISTLNKRDDINSVLGSWSINELRKIKDANECLLLKKASKMNDEAIEFGINHISKDLSELALTDKIESFF